MKKAAAMLALCALISAALLPLPVYAESNEIIISTRAEFEKFAADCVYDDFADGKTFKLGADIDFGGGGAQVPIFGGTFDGAGHSLLGISIEKAGSGSGLFGIVAENGVIKNLTVTASVSPSGTKSNAAVIAGVNRGRIENCTAYGSVTADERAGGIVGENTSGGVIENCKNYALITSLTSSGGICGVNAGSLNSCENYGNINSDCENSLLSYVGGIVGQNSGTVTGCTNRGATANYGFGSSVGGIAGQSTGNVLDCANYGRTEASSAAGGIVGAMASSAAAFSVEGCVNRAEIRAISNAGGIVGESSSTTNASVVSCVNIGAVTVKNSNAGGIAGNFQGLGSIVDCASGADVTASSYAGGIVGRSTRPVLRCAANSRLAASRDVGGIAASAQNITASYAVCEIDCEGENVGGVAGSASGTLSNNYFLSDDVGGVAGINYRDRAEPVTFSQLVSEELPLPERLNGFDDTKWYVTHGEAHFPIPATLTEKSEELKTAALSALAASFSIDFVADGVTVYTVRVEYGGSVPESIFPPVPKKNGYAGKWAGIAENVTRNITVTAVYDRTLSTVEAKSQSVLAEGLFAPGTEFDVAEIPFEDSLPISNYTVCAAYSMMLETDSEITVRVKTDAKNPVAVYRTADGLATAECRYVGSYVVFTLPAPCDFAVLTQGTTFADMWWVIPTAAGAVLIASVTTIALLRKRRRKTAEK